MPFKPAKSLQSAILRRWKTWKLPSRRVGRIGERSARSYLQRRGLECLACNVRCGRGEIDLICRDGDTLVFVEVKTRSVGSFGHGLDRLDRRKRKALRAACRAYLSSLRWEVASYRVDAVCVVLGAPRWIFRPVLEVEWYQSVLSLDD